MILHFAEPMSTKTLCGLSTTKHVNGDWKAVDCKVCLRRRRGRALKNARYFGAECQANPGMSKLEYIDDMAEDLGYASWDDVPIDDQTALSKAFREGREDEKKASASIRGGGAS